MKFNLPPRKLRLCLEGWYYLLVLGFIASAAVLRAANLLLILAAMLIVPLLFNWQFVMASTRRLFLRRRLPLHIEAGKKFLIHLTMGNQRRSLDSWRIAVEESITHKTLQGTTRTVAMLDRIPAGGEESISYQGLLMDRGEYEMQPSTVSTTFPMGLLRASTCVPNKESIFVSPRLGKLSKDWRRWIPSEDVHEPRSVGKKGINDGLFYAIRDYRQGDSRRSIHWRSTAKMGRPAVKQFERQNDQELNLILDLFAFPETPVGRQQPPPDVQNIQPPSPAGSTSDPQAELAVSFLATLLSQVCHQGRHELNCLILGDQDCEYSGAASPKFQRKVNESLAVVQPSPVESVTSRIQSFVETNHSRSSLLVITTRKLDQGERSEQQLPSTIATNDGRLLRCQWISVLDPSFEKMFDPKEDQSKTGLSSSSQSSLAVDRSNGGDP
mgnify:CR=1 FL=1|jgi:uncharacterized protein (DUF58 family)